jgi:hypothetical protein
MTERAEQPGQQRPLCPHCGVMIERLAVWSDDRGLTAIFFCPECAKAFGAQLLRPLTAEERGTVI